MCVCVRVRERKEYLREMEIPKTQELLNQTCIPRGMDMCYPCCLTPVRM